MQKKAISYFPIFPYFWYAMFECFPSTKMQQTFVLQFVLGSHTIWLDYYYTFALILLLKVMESFMQKCHYLTLNNT